MLAAGAAIHDVLNAYVVAALECVTIPTTRGTGDCRVTEFIAVVDVRAAMIFEVFTGSFDAVVKAALADFVELAGRYFPRIAATWAGAAWSAALVTGIALWPLGEAAVWRGGEC
jgi:hypothetical protein